MEIIMRRQFVGGNWKMNGSRVENAKLLSYITSELANEMETDVVVFPSYVYLQQANSLLMDTPVFLGAQNLSEHDKGAYTGEISALMLTDLDCRYVLIGHSERRQLFGETDALIAAKFAKAQEHHLVPVLCIGETLEQRESEQTEAVVQAQLDAVIDACGVESLANSVIAYEPVWAIGTGLTATPEQAQAVHAFIRKHIAAKNAEIAAELRIIYGGSVKGDNAEAIFAMQDIDGGLIGGASLKAEEFVKIVRSVKVG